MFLFSIVFKGPWFENYLGTIKPLNDNDILQTVLIILEKLKKEANSQLMPFPRGNICIFYLIPIL